MKTILFYWSKGAEVRMKVVRLIVSFERKNEPCYLQLISDKLGLSHVAIKKHVDLLIEEGYVNIINPGGKPSFLELTDMGREVAKEFSS